MHVPVALPDEEDQMPGVVASGFHLTAYSDGCLLLEKTPRTLRRGSGVRLALALFWNGLVAVLYGYLILSGGWRMPLFSVPMFLIVGPVFVLTGAWLAVDALWRLCGREAWLVSINELRWRGRLFGRGWERVLRFGRLTVRRHDSAASAGTHLLIASGIGDQQRILYEAADLAEVEEVAAFLAARLGWPVTRTTWGKPGATGAH